MKRPPVAWVLNLDAENELESGKRYTPTKRLLSIVSYRRSDLLGTLVEEDDVVLDAEPSPNDGRACGLPGLAWSPTPRALARLRAAGAIPVPAPAFEVLAAVNARAFAVRVRAPLAADSFQKDVVWTLDEVLERLAHPTPDGWLVRRPFGAAGRGRRRIAAGAPDEAERAWIAAGLRRGALVVEPWVEVTREYTRSAWLDRDGLVHISPPCFQATTAQGAWTRTEAASAGEVDREDDARLQEMVERVGAALFEAGYVGPFGIDAYRHRVPGGSGAPDVLNPLSEINARLTMDWAIGMGEQRCRALLTSTSTNEGAGRGDPAAGSSITRA